MLFSLVGDSPMHAHTSNDSQIRVVHVDCDIVCAPISHIALLSRCIMKPIAYNDSLTSNNHLDIEQSKN